MTQYFDAASEYACRRLVTDFVEALDSSDYDRFRDLLTEDAVFARPSDPDNPIQGAENIVAAFHKRPKELLTWHLLTNISIKFESADLATGYCYIVMYKSNVNAPVLPVKGRKTEGEPLIGAYVDRFVRTPEGWRIADRRGKVFSHT